jgi:hypothetical protein
MSTKPSRSARLRKFEHVYEEYIKNSSKAEPKKEPKKAEPKKEPKKAEPKKEPKKEASKAVAPKKVTRSPSTKARKAAKSPSTRQPTRYQEFVRVESQKQYCKDLPNKDRMKAIGRAWSELKEREN